MANSAVGGAAYRAKHGFIKATCDCSFAEITSCLPEPTLACRPYSDADQIYKPMIERYRRFLQTIEKSS